MKANELPEKIYLSYETDDKDYNEHIFIDYMWHRHPFEGKNLKNVEYTRSDAFIEKAVEWIKNNGSHYIDIVNGQLVLKKGIIKDFKKYMKG